MKSECWSVILDLTAAKSTITNQFCTLHNLRGKHDPLINAPWFRWQALPPKWDNGSKICFIFKQRDGWQLLPTEIACKLAPVSDENPSPQLESGVATGSGYVSICCSQTYKHGERGTKKEYQQKAGSTFSLPTLAVPVCKKPSSAAAGLCTAVRRSNVGPMAFAYLDLTYAWWDWSW